MALTVTELAEQKPLGASARQQTPPRKRQKKIEELLLCASYQGSIGVLLGYWKG